MADNVTTQELETALQDLATGLGLSVKEYVEGGFLDLTTYGTDKAAIVARLDALDVIDGADGVDTLAEKVVALNAIFTENGNLATDVLNRIAANTTAIGAVQNELTDYKTANDAVQAIQDANIASLQSGQSALTSTVAANKTASEAADAALDVRATAVEGDIATLKGDDTVVGSVANAVKAETSRAQAAEAANASAATAAIATAKQEAIDAAGVVSAAGDAALQTQIDALGTAGTATEAAITAAQAELDATQAAIGLNADGSFTPVDGADTLEEYVQDVAGDANTVRKAIRKVARKSKATNIALGARIDAAEAAATGLAADLATEVSTRTTEVAAGIAATTAVDNRVTAEIADRTAADTSLQTQIDALGGSGSGSLGDVENRIDVIEGELNDGVDGNGDLVKGVKTKVQDNAAAIAAEEAARVAAFTQLDTDLKAYSDARDLKAASMDMCAVGNKFRQALGLADNSCGATPPPAGDGL